MSRWTPDARGRLEKAAYELILERGYEQTTVADIAERAGLTERTFFRHYADKREVLFGGSALMQDELLRALDEVPPALPAIEAVGIAVEAVAILMNGRRAYARERQRIVAKHADLQERDMIKRATLTAALAQGLQKRGLPEASASIAADMGIGVFYVGFVRWLDDAEARDFVMIIHEGFDQLKAVASGA
jgi:AcrR family transcriptional regulator